MIELAGSALVVVSAVEALVFCVAYHLSAPWRETTGGRHIMAFTAVLALVLTLWVARLLLPLDWAGWDVARLVTFAGVPVVLGHRLLLLYRLQIKPAFRKGSHDRTR